MFPWQSQRCWDQSETFVPVAEADTTRSQDIFPQVHLSLSQADED